MAEGFGKSEERSRMAGAATGAVRGGAAGATRETSREAARAASAASAASAAEGADEGAAEKTFSQAEVERIVQERLAAEQERGRGELERMATVEQEKLEAMLARLKERAVEAQVAMHGARLNLVDAELALAWVQSRVEFDANGEPTNVEKLLLELVQSKPFMVKAGGAPPSPTSAANPGGGKAASKFDAKRPPSWGAAFGKR